MTNGLKSLPCAPPRLPSDESLRAISYDPDTGEFTWLESRGGVRAGSRAGNVMPDKGYLRIRLDGVLVLAHRLAWRLYWGAWPVEFIDHINCERDDNRICNLREATRSQNCRNRRVAPGRIVPKGVTAHRKRYRARIGHVDIGSFDTAEEAHAAYAEAARLAYGEFARLA